MTRYNDATLRRAFRPKRNGLQPGGAEGRRHFGCRYNSAPVIEPARLKAVPLALWQSPRRFFPASDVYNLFSNPRPARRRHTEPARQLHYVSQPYKPGAMFGRDYRWRFEHSAGIADRKQGRKLFAGEFFRFGCHCLSMTPFRHTAWSTLLIPRRPNLIF
jgi:hypothetical protein